MKLDCWVIVWVRPHADYPTITSNIANEECARQMARVMLDEGHTTDILAVCPAEALRYVTGSVFNSTDLDRNRTCCECCEPYVCDLSHGSKDDPVFCPACVKAGKK